ncbi:MAG: CoA pyrophosphatase [Gemmatimonadetes bacterium]|nr:CoA pyrophosphatase [Gemmatimonadota bacterium]
MLRPPLGEPDPPLGLCELLTIERAKSPHDPWSGQMALPGGRLDPADGSLIEAAVRETREETGVRLEAPEGMLGRSEPLRPLRPENPPISVWPFVFRALSQTTAHVASPEVASVHWFALADLADPRNLGSVAWTGGSAARSLPCIRLEGRAIWGLTYRIVTRFMEVTLP